MGSEYKLSHVYPQSKPFMDDNGRRKLAQKRAAQDLRVQTLNQEAAKRQKPSQEHIVDAENQPDVQQQQPRQYAADGPMQQQDKPGATDFSGFLQQLEQEKQGGQQLPAYLERRASHHQQQQQQPQQQQQQLQKSPNMIDQLLSQHSLHAAPTSVMELNSMMSLDRTFPPDASRDGFIRAPSAAAAANSEPAAAASAAAAAGIGPSIDRWHLRSLQQIPWDWSVKSKVKLGSAAPLAVLQERAGTSMAPDCAAIAAGSHCTAAAAASNQQRLSQLLLQWQYPATALSNTVMAALRADREGAVSLNNRVANWQQALVSGFAALRHGQCPVMYVIGQAFRQTFTVIFCSAGVMGHPGLHAVISRSNKQLRTYLAAMGCYGVQAGALEQQQQPQQGQQPRRPAAMVTSFDGQPGSQLLLVGTQQVHCLHAALLTLPWCETEQPDVPLLLAPVQFMYAQLCPLRLQALPDSVLDHQQQQQGGALQPLHYAELLGSTCIMPWTVHRLLQLLRETQGDAEFDVWMDTDAYNSSVNVLHSTWQQLPAPAEGGSATGRQQQQQHWQVAELGFSSSEQLEWLSSSELLQGRVLRQLRVMAKQAEIAARLA